MAKLIECDTCGGKISDDTEQCIHCGAKTQYAKDGQLNLEIIWYLVFIVILLGSWALDMSIGEFILHFTVVIIQGLFE